MALDIVDALRLGFLGATAAVLLLYPLPSLRYRFLEYGARTTPSTTTEAEKHLATSKKYSAREESLANILDRIAALKVPHSYFTSFYVTSVTLSSVWLLDCGLGFPVTTRFIQPYLSSGRPSTPFHRTLLMWLALTIQGSRRLYECHTFASPSTAQMWVGHWAMGYLFYAFLSTSVWIEGLPALQAHQFTVADLSIQAPSFRTLLSLSLFVLASGIQHDAHAYLYALKTRPFEELHPNLARSSSTSAPAPVAPSSSSATKYKLPQHPAFHRTLTPHYFAECVVYLSWCFLAAPTGRWVNWTMVCVLVFVVGNLGLTAHGTREWYVRRFGKKALEGRARMVPFAF